MHVKMWSTEWWLRFSDQRNKHFINDMAEKLQSFVRLFIDDTIIYLDGQCDAMALQHDIDLLAECEQT